MAIVNLFTFPHFIVMLIAIIFFTISILMVILHKPQNWFLLHKVFASVGALTSIIGIISLGGLVLGILHGILGLITIISLICVIIIGTIAIRKKKRNIRATHILISRIIYIVTLGLVILGIITFLFF